MTKQFRCKKCSVLGHRENECGSTETKCHHCSAEHFAGHRDCPKYQEEQKIIEVMQREKVTLQRARQMINEKPVTRTASSRQSAPFPTLFDVTMPKGTKRKTSPWFVEKAIKSHWKTPKEMQRQASTWRHLRCWGWVRGRSQENVHTQENRRPEGDSKHDCDDGW